MKCSDTRPLLDLLSDGALEAKDSALVLDHLKSCAECHREWNELEQLRSTFDDAKQNFSLPAGLMYRVSAKLDAEAKNQRKQFFAQYVYSLPMAAIAAILLLIGFVVVPMIHQTNSKSTAVQTASADALVDDLVSASAVEPVADRTELAKKLGYGLKYIQLPSWNMNKSGVYKSQASTPIARFDFVRKGQSGYQYLSCYQAPQDSIQTTARDVEDINGRHVVFGNRGRFQFAL